MISWISATDSSLGKSLYFPPRAMGDGASDFYIGQSALTATTIVTTVETNTSDPNPRSALGVMRRKESRPDRIAFRFALGQGARRCACRPRTGKTSRPGTWRPSPTTTRGVNCRRSKRPARTWCSRRNRERNGNDYDQEP